MLHLQLVGPVLVRPKLVGPELVGPELVLGRVLFVRVEVGCLHLELLVLPPFELCLVFELALHASQLGHELVLLADQLDGYIFGGALAFELLFEVDLSRALVVCDGVGVVGAASFLQWPAAFVASGGVGVVGAASVVLLGWTGSVVL